jgi:translation elongation factor EF-4
MTPKPRTIDKLGVGEVGFIVANIKTVADVSIGDTVTEAARRTLNHSLVSGDKADGLAGLPDRDKSSMRAA